MDMEDSRLILTSQVLFTIDVRADRIFRMHNFKVACTSSKHGLRPRDMFGHEEFGKPSEAERPRPVKRCIRPPDAVGSVV